MTYSDFDASTAGDFVESLASERNQPGRHARWRAGLASASVRGVYQTLLPRGFSLGNIQMLRLPKVYDNTFSKVALPNREILQHCGRIPFPATRITPSVFFSRNPVVRYFFRVRGVAEMVGWGSVFTYDETAQPSEHFGNKYYITSGQIRPQLQQDAYNVINDFSPRTDDGLRYFTGMPDTAFTKSICINRTQEPSGFNNRGTYFFDRIVSVSGVAAQSPSFEIGVTSSLYFNGVEFYNGGAPPGVYNYTTERTRLILGESFGSLGAALFWSNTTETNPKSLFDDDDNGGGPNMIRAGGFFVTGEDTGTAPIGMTNIVEGRYIGCRAESAIRPETITDLQVPVLLTEFDA